MSIRLSIVHSICAILHLVHRNAAGFAYRCYLFLHAVEEAPCGTTPFVGVAQNEDAITVKLLGQNFQIRISYKVQVSDPSCTNKFLYRSKQVMSDTYADACLLRKAFKRCQLIMTAIEVTTNLFRCAFKRFQLIVTAIEVTKNRFRCAFK